MKNVVLGVLILLVIGLGGVIIYDKFMEEKGEVVIEDKIDNESKLDEQNKYQESEPKTDEINKYQEYLNNLEKNILPKTARFMIPVENNSKVDFKGRNIYLDRTGNLYLMEEEDLNVDKNRIEKIPSLLDIGTNGVRLNISNIVDIFYIDGIGQSAIGTLYALDNKGNIYFIASSFDWSDSEITKKDFEPTKIEELKNVISINGYCYFNGASGGYLAEVVDIDGNKYDLLDYTEKYHIYDEAL